MRSEPGANWIRIEGLLGRNEIISEYKSLIGLPGQLKD
jgi:protein SCO1/2